MSNTACYTINVDSLLVKTLQHNHVRRWPSLPISRVAGQHGQRSSRFGMILCPKKRLPRNGAYQQKGAYGTSDIDNQPKEKPRLQDILAPRKERPETSALSNAIVLRVKVALQLADMRTLKRAERLWHVVTSAIELVCATPPLLRTLIGPTFSRETRADAICAARRLTRRTGISTILQLCQEVASIHTAMLQLATHIAITSNT